MMGHEDTKNSFKILNCYDISTSIMLVTWEHDWLGLASTKSLFAWRSGVTSSTNAKVDNKVVLPAMSIPPFVNVVTNLAAMSAA